MVFLAGAFYMLCDVARGGSDDGGNAGGFKPVDIILFRQQVGGGDGDRADFMQRQDGEPELVMTLEHQHDHIAFLNAMLDEQVGSLIGIPAHIIKSKNFFLSLIIAPDHCAAVRFQPGNFVYHVVSKIKIFFIDRAKSRTDLQPLQISLPIPPPSAQLQ